MIIFNKQNASIVDVPITQKSVYVKTLMGEHHIELNFALGSYFKFEKGSYVLYLNQRFYIMEDHLPSQGKNDNGWHYSLKFEAVESLLKYYNIFYHNGQRKEASFSLTSGINDFGNVIIDCLNRDLSTFNWRLKVVDDKLNTIIKPLSFKGDKLINALKLVSEAFECEWWCEPNGITIDICFGKRIFGSEELLEIGDAIRNISGKKSNNDKYGTRFFAYGGTRNLTNTYRKTDSSSPLNCISETRLQLPQGIEYVDSKENLAKEDIIQQIAIFDDIYPINEDTISGVRLAKRQDEGKEPFDAYIISSKDSPFKPSDIIEGEALKCQFQTGLLQGREFELIININDFNGEFELKAIDEGDGENTLIIPNDFLCPKVGDKFVLTGVKLPEERVTQAEQRLLETTKNWAKKCSQDITTYECPTNVVFCTQNQKSYDVGQRVLLSDIRFGDKGRASRILGFEKKLANIFDATYKVGDNQSSSRLDTIENNIKQSQYAKRIGVDNGSKVYLIRSAYDHTIASEYNAYSAMASDKRYVKQHGNAQINELNVEDKAKFKELIKAYKGLSSNSFSSGFLGSGTFLDLEKSELTIDKLNVRKQATFYELLIDSLRHSGGMSIMSSGAIKLKSVFETRDGYTCYFEDKEGEIKQPFVSGDLVRCQTFGTSSKYYWAEVLSTGNNYFLLSKTHVDGELNPKAGDEVVQLGNLYNTSRQSAIVMSTVGNDAPYIALYKGINSFSLEGKMVLRLGDLSNIIDSTMGHLKGTGLYAENVHLKGKFQLENGNDVGEVLSSKASSTEVTTQVLGINNEVVKRTAATNKQIADTKRALENYAQAKANLAKQEAIANADGKITTEEKARIEQAKQTLQSAKDHANNAVATIQIGGRNLLPGTKDFTAGWKTNGVFENDGEYRTCKVTDRWKYPYFELSRLNLTEGKKYTLSLYAKSDSSVRLWLYNGHANYFTSEDDNNYTTDQWRRFYLTFTYDSSFSRASAETSNQNINLWTCKYKLEEGNKATSWTPAPEDMDLKVREVKETLESSISQTNKEISLKVSKIYVDDKVNKIQNVGINLIEDSFISKWSNTSPVCERSFEAEEGVEYTLSFYGKRNEIAQKDGAWLKGAIRNEDWSWSKSTALYSLEISKSTYTFKAPTTGKLWISFVVHPNGRTTGKVFLEKFKLEKGNKATDWTPGLTDQVYRNKIISEINQTAEEIKISASKIQIDGSTTFAPGYNPRDKIGLGKLDHTIIEGGKIKTDLIKTREITALGNVEAGSFNLGNGKFVVTPEGQLTAQNVNIIGNLSSGVGGERVELNSKTNRLNFYRNNELQLSFGAVGGGSRGVSFRKGHCGLVIEEARNSMPFSLHVEGLTRIDNIFLKGRIVVGRNYRSVPIGDCRAPDYRTWIDLRSNKLTHTNYIVVGHLTIEEGTPWQENDVVWTIQGKKKEGFYLSMREISSGSQHLRFEFIIVEGSLH